MAEDPQRSQNDVNATRSGVDAGVPSPVSDTSRPPAGPPQQLSAQQRQDALSANPSPSAAAGPSLDVDAAELAAAIAAEQALNTTPDASRVALPDLTAQAAAGGSLNSSAIDLLADVDLNVKVELGRSRLLVDEVLRLAPGSVVELDKLAGDPVDVFVNERLVARGEVLVLNENFCVRINEITADFGEPLGRED
jgi:flagellar motor switch protein FliN/FliY